VAQPFSVDGDRVRHPFPPPRYGQGPAR
jgi:hypothetical protein